MATALTWCWALITVTFKLIIDLLSLLWKIPATSAGYLFKKNRGSKEKKNVHQCSATSCKNDYYAKGYCKRHYTQILRHGRLTPERERGNEKPCISPNCNRVAKGYLPYCRKHARQIKKHGKLTPTREKQYGNTGCIVPGCTSTHRSKGLCTKHYARVRYRYIKNRFRNGSAKSFEYMIRQLVKDSYV